MKTWSFYHVKTGKFSARTFSGPDSWQPRVPRDHVATEGTHDHLSKAFDIASGLIVDYQPPQPDSDHHWDDRTIPGRPRWRKRPEVIESEQQRAQMLSGIEALERKQARIMRELIIDETAVGEDGKTPRERLRKLDQDIAAIRSTDRTR